MSCSLPLSLRWNWCGCRPFTRLPSRSTTVTGAMTSRTVTLNCGSSAGACCAGVTYVQMRKHNTLATALRNTRMFFMTFTLRTTFRRMSGAALQQVEHVGHQLDDGVQRLHRAFG